MKRILFVIGIMGKGGAERVIANLSNYLVTKGWDITIVTIYGSRQDYKLNNNVYVQPINCKFRMKILRPLERMAKLRNYVKTYNPDFVISFLADVNIHTIFSLIGLKIKLIVSERNDPNRDPKSRLIRKLRDLIYRYADGIVFQTKDAKKYFENKLTPKNKVAVIPNPIKDNLPLYDSRNAKKNVFVTACRLDIQKNLKMMIDALAVLIKNGITCYLNIYGEGPLKDELQAYICDNNLTKYVKLCGFSTNIHDNFLQSTAFVISSDYEGISNSMLEALAIGIPVIATDCPIGGARMYINDGVNGILVPCRDIEKLSSAMKFVLSNEDKAVLMGQNAITLRNELNSTKIADFWIEYLNSF